MRPASMPARPTGSIRGELDAYGGGLAEKSEIVALSKIDAIDEETLKLQRERSEAGDAHLWAAAR